MKLANVESQGSSSITPVGRSAPSIGTGWPTWLSQSWRPHRIVVNVPISVTRETIPLQAAQRGWSASPIHIFGFRRWKITMRSSSSGWRGGRCAAHKEASTEAFTSMIRSGIADHAGHISQVRRDQRSPVGRRVSHWRGWRRGLRAAHLLRFDREAAPGIRYLRAFMAGNPPPRVLDPGIKILERSGLGDRVDKHRIQPFGSKGSAEFAADIVSVSHEGTSGQKSARRSNVGPAIYHKVSMFYIYIIAGERLLSCHQPKKI